MRMTEYRHGLAMLWGDTIAYGQREWRCAVWATGYPGLYMVPGAWHARTPAQQILYQKLDERLEQPTQWLISTATALAGAAGWSWQQRSTETWIYFAKRGHGLALVRTVQGMVEKLGEPHE